MSTIQQIFFLPPMATARLGGSDVPLDSFTWIEDPTLHGAGNTVITAAVNLEVLADGSVSPKLPAVIQFRDGSLLRPTAPFFELWAQIEGIPDIQPLTTSLLAQSGGSISGVTFTVTAANRKAARRTGDDSCAYSARIQVTGDDHSSHPLLASSIGAQALVPASNPIPLGSFQVIRPTNGIVSGVDLSVLRIRFTPAKGLVYGPPSATSAAEPEFPNRTYQLVPPENRFLNQNSSWVSYSSDNSPNSPEPADTYDGADDQNRNDLSYGIVDDTCDLLIEAIVIANGQRFRATARAFSAPPDFAPDRRPFASLAEMLIDRDPPKVEPDENPIDALDRLADLFQRVFETVSLANIDAMRQRAIGGGQQGGRASDSPKTNDDSMTPRDQPYYRPDQEDIGPATTEERLPYADAGKEHHEPLAEAEGLALFLHDNGPFVRKLIRPPYGTFADLAVNPSQTPNPAHRDPRVQRDLLHDMRMPPYMLDEIASPLGLTVRQYNFLMKMVDQFAASAATGVAPTAAALAKAKKAAKGKKSAKPSVPAVPLTRAFAHVKQVVNRRKGDKKA